MWKNPFGLGLGATLAALFAVLPANVRAAGFADLLNPIIPQTGVCACPGSAMDWGCVVQVVQNLLNLGLTFGTLMVIFFIMYAGAMMLMNPNSASERTKARTRLFNAVFGLAVMLSAWLIVDYIMKFLYNPNVADFGPWNSILASRGDDYCIDPTQQGILTQGVVDTIGNVLSTGSSHSSAGGACKVPGSGPCSAQVLERTCFGNRATEAAQICNVESGGRTNVKSGSDKLDGGSGPSYSVGLWQINLTTSPVGGLNCPAAFDKPCQGKQLVGPSKPGACYSKIVNRNLYDRCVAAAQNPENSTAVACTLYKPRGFQPWAYTANKCSIPQRI